MRRQNSSNAVNGPPISRSRMSAWMSPRPTPLIATRPKRRSPFSTVKSASDALMSGGSRRMPSSRHSAMYSVTFGVLSSTEVSSAAMYSCG